MINHSFIKKKLKELLIKYYQETVADDHRRQSLESINLLKKDDFEKQKGQYSSIDVETLLCQGSVFWITASFFALSARILVEHRT